jgi:predicted DNA-binding helix-hairpin-helix protein
VIGVERILRARREASLNSLEQLKKLKVITGRAAPFLLLNGRQTVSTVQGRVRSRTQAKPEQLSLWDEMAQDGTEHPLAGAAG